jgi:hypothetical protein
MIPAVHARGTRVGGLLRYLYGPGKPEEHTNPHLVAAWDGSGDLADLEPATTATGRREFRHLTDLLEIPVRAGRNAPHKTVWHCSVRAHASDRLLSDEQWGHIAAEVVARVGLARPGDLQAVRWVAVRHADDHIHIAATLVRQDRRTVWPRRDYALTQAACRDIEQRLGLYRVCRPGQGSRSWPNAAETNKAVRNGRAVTPREQLRRTVREVATIAVDEQDFLRRLTGAGVLVRLRPSSRDPNQITGYAVAVAGDATAAGEPIYYGGGKLAADLSLPRLRRRWDRGSSLAGSDRRAHRLQPAPAEVYQRAAGLIAQAADELRARAADTTAATGVAAAAADVFTAMATRWEGAAGGPLTRAAELFDRAAHQPSPYQPARRGTPGFALRAIARLLHATGDRRDDRQLEALLTLVRAMSELTDTLADLRAAQQRADQADAARAAAALLNTYTPPKPLSRTSPGASSPLPSRQGILMPTTAARRRRR